MEQTVIKGFMGTSLRTQVEIEAKKMQQYKGQRLVLKLLSILTESLNAYTKPTAFCRQLLPSTRFSGDKTVRHYLGHVPSFTNWPSIR